VGGALAAAPGLATAQVHFDKFDRTLDCAQDPCAQVLPKAASFVPVQGRPWAQGLDAAGAPVGWVTLSTEVVDIKGYSGKPLVTLVGLDDRGVVAGARVVHHSEPILLVGIPEEKLHTFVDAHVGLRADQPVVVGGEAEGEAFAVDVISGATVTVLAESRTVMETARHLGEEVGVIERAPRVAGHFVHDGPALTWSQMVADGVLGHLVVTPEQMGQRPGDTPFIDIWFGIADAGPVGRALLGDRVWTRSLEELAPGEHLVVMFGNGTSSFKGSGFVRGGIFDRVRLEQGVRQVVFRDLDYSNVGQPAAPDAPSFKEGALFVSREDRLDPGMAYELVFLASAFTLSGGIERSFHSYRATHRLPKSVYVLDGPDPESLVWRRAWKLRRGTVALVVGYFLAVMGVFAGRRWTAASVQRIKRIHTGFLLVSLVGLGLSLSLQPSITQLLTLADGVRGEWRWGLFLSDPLLFVTWIFIAVSTALWGRGVFCGWVCPYGALSELLFKAGRTLGLPEYEAPDAVHNKARLLRYVVFGVLLTVFLLSPQVGERMAEIEPFKSTFFVPPWTRHLALFGYWSLLLVASLFTFRPFCRYLCPLGAALALPSSARLSSPYRRPFCAKGCQICPRGCEPRAFRKDGTIDPRECLNCWECEATYHDVERCPPLVQIRRRADKAEQADDHTGAARLRAELEAVR
jgi:NosR/NirI family nitrous oxide reductase transcriptional regulator